ncbi:MAG: hypothetical protein HZB87_07310 [Desulfatitalea sp.]|nr:hypothetical protein [Desulfatitalea sp.]
MDQNLKGAAGIWNQRLQIPAARFKVKILGIAWPQRRAVGVKIIFLEADSAFLATVELLLPNSECTEG